MKFKCVTLQKHSLPFDEQGEHEKAPLGLFPFHAKEND
jgi:hypothetical protein